MPITSWVPLVIVVAFGVTWGLLGSLSRRGARRRRQREKFWARFAQGHRELDHDLDEVWHRG